MLLGLFAIRKVYDYEGEGGRMEYNDFPSKVCCLTGPRIFVVEFICVPETFGYPNGL